MNAPINRVFLVIALLFAVLVVFTSRWTVFEADALRDNPRNKREEIAERKTRRGAIRTADGKLIARSVKAADGTYRRRYADGPLFGHPIGYAYPDIGASQFERAQDDDLLGRTNSLLTIWESLRGPRDRGNSVVTTLDGDAQRVAIDGLAGRPGAVVALNVRTGAVEAMASTPTYDPNDIDDPDVLASLNRDEQGRPLVDRAVFDAGPPGSTFKVVTAAAALDSGRFSPESRLDGRSPIEVSGTPLANFNGEQFGQITLTEALTHSVNTVWARVGEQLGKARMSEYMERFGFGTRLDIDLPVGQVLPSGEYVDGEVISGTSRRVDVGRMAIGQDKLLTTPLQMAVVAATIANGGVRMRPHLTARVIDPDGRTLRKVEPHEEGRVISEEAAGQLSEMMRNVVAEGTGTAAALQGVTVAGKTGTAELNIEKGINQPWFIGFAGDTAVAVTLDRVPGGQGGVVAAPIARAVLQSLGED